MEIPMENESRKPVVLKLGAAFTAGLVLFILQFGPGTLWDPLFFLITMPFRSWHIFIKDGVLVVGCGLIVLMLVSAGICIWSRSLLWIAYVLIAACWLWAYVVITLFI